MHKIAIVEDDDKDAKVLTDFLDCYSKENNIPLDVSRFKNADSFLFDYQKKYDIIFMDIMMPGTNGMESARKLREVDNDTILIFVTTVARMAIHGYEVGALDFVLKPLEYPSFSLKLSRAFSKIKKTNSKVISLKTTDGLQTINEADILYVEVCNHILIYHLLDKDIEMYGSLKRAQEELSSRDFFKTNNCFLVNMNYVTRIDGYELTLNDKINLAISHPKRSEFVKAYHSFLTGD